jgi:hypothetical protein
MPHATLPAKTMLFAGRQTQPQATNSAEIAAPTVPRLQKTTLFAGRQTQPQATNSAEIAAGDFCQLISSPTPL